MYSSITLQQLMNHRSDRVRRQAIAIYKMLPEENAKIGKAYITDAMTRQTPLDQKFARISYEQDNLIT